MGRYIELALDQLKQRLLNLGSMVEDSVVKAVDSFINLDQDLASEVIKNDKKIDKEEVEIEEDCLKLLALYQPLAVDLRFVTSVLKINNDLERVGDLAVNIARKANYLSLHGNRSKINFDYSPMAKKVQLMLKQSLDAFIHRDANLAQEVCDRDKDINDLKKTFKRMILDKMKENSEIADILLRHHALTRHLERIADMATNIAEEVIYIIHGRIIRHEFEEDYLEDFDD